MRQTRSESDETTLHLSRKSSFAVYTCVALLVALSLYDRFAGVQSPHPHTKIGSAVMIALDVILVLVIGSTLLRWWFERLVAGEDDFRSYNFLNRAGPRYRFADLTDYRSTPFGGWFLYADRVRIKRADVETAEFHRLMVERAPKALRAKRWKGGQVPPAEPMESLMLFDGLEMLSHLAGSAVIALPLYLILGPVAFGYMALSMMQELYRLLDVPGRLSLDSEGMRARWPWERREIAWDQVTAIFCERAGRHRRFVVTGPSTSITIPRHLAQDLDVMRKVLYSLPSGTLCVNFDESIRRGYRRRGRRRLALGTPSLDPAFGAGF